MLLNYLIRQTKIRRYTCIRNSTQPWLSGRAAIAELRQDINIKKAIKIKKNIYIYTVCFPISNQVFIDLVIYY